MTEDDLRVAILKQRKLFGSQKELAEAIGISEQNLNRFICGQPVRFRAMQEAIGGHVAMVRVLKPDIEL